MADYYRRNTGATQFFAFFVCGILGGRMIPFILIRKILVSLVPLALFYLLKKVAKKQHLPKRKSRADDFDSSIDLKASKSRIVEGEIVEEKP